MSNVLRNVIVGFKILKNMKKNIQTFVVSDCRDENAKARYIASFARVTNGPVYTFGISSLLEGAGTAIDIVDSLKGGEAIVFLNVAPRRDKDKNENHKNGRPFYYFFYKRTLIVTSSENEIFSMFAHVGLDFKNIKAIDFEKIKNIPRETQFRSAQCVPEAVKQILEKKYNGKKVFEDIKIEKIPFKIWCIDNFGNCKTTALEFTEEVNIPKYKSMNDVKDGEAAQIFGSSGFLENRFIELIIKGKSYDIEKNK